MIKDNKKIFIFHYEVLICFFIVLTGCASAAIKKTQPHFPYQHIENILGKEDFREPSGIVFHRERKSLFVVGDQGDICEIKTDGTIVAGRKQIYNNAHADFEGITYNPATGLLYIAIEDKGKILEIEADGFKVLREFTIDRSFQGRIGLVQSKKHGIEGITFAPELNHPEGGVFYVTNQNAPSAIFEIEAPLKSSSGLESTAKITGYFPFELTDLSGIYYEQSGNYLYVISDEHNFLLKATRKGEIIETYAQFQGEDQEGIALDTEGAIYIAQDSGGVIKVNR